MMNALLEEIEAAFQTIEPVRRAFAVHKDGVDYACVIVALALHRSIADRNDPEIGKDDAANSCLEWASQVFGEDFIWGLISAWDGQEAVKNDPDFLKGYTLGLQAVNMLFPCDPPC
jgi:hypothetical protein